MGQARNPEEPQKIRIFQEIDDHYTKQERILLLSKKTLELAMSNQKKIVYLTTDHGGANQMLSTN